MILKCIIVDDEPNARALLKSLLDEFIDTEIELIGEAQDLNGLVNLLQTRKPDLIFLDLEMKSSFGFDLFQKIEKKYFEVVITSAHSQYALKAFEYGIAGYLVKPISPFGLRGVINRVIQILSKSKEPQISFHTQDGQVPIPVGKISRIEADRNYSWVHGTFGKPILISKNLGLMESQLADHGFIRIHHSHLVAKAHIVKVRKVENMLEMADGSLVPFSRERRKSLISSIKGI